MNGSIKLLEIIGAFFMLAFIISVIAYVILAIGLWRIFEKAGKPGWHAIIPFLNLYGLAEISGNSPVLFLIILVPGFGLLIYDILIGLGLAKNFGQSTGFGVLTIFFMPIMLCVLGFGNFTYQGNLASGAPGTSGTPGDPGTPGNPSTPGASNNSGTPGNPNNVGATQKPNKPISNDPWVNGQV